MLKMAGSLSLCFVVAFAFSVRSSATRSNGVTGGAGAVGAAQVRSLLQSWARQLDVAGAREGAKDTPVTRVVNLLKEMKETLRKEMDEDEALYDKLKCWCSNNKWEKSNAISASQAKISDLQASIESLTARSAGLKTSIEELEGEAAADKKALAEATALREKQQQEFHGGELDSIQAIENLKAALTVLAKHHASAPESTVAGGPIYKSEQSSWESLLAVGSTHSKDGPWGAEHEVAQMSHSLDDFMRRNGFATTDGEASAVTDKRMPQKFLQHDSSNLASDSFGTAGWSGSEALIIQHAMKSASAFMQAHHGEGYYPAYNARSGEIVGVLQQLKDEMEADLSEAQKLEMNRAAAFEELRAAKAAEIQNGERMAEQKEDALATTNNALAEAKEDLGQEQAALSADQKFVANLNKTCSEATRDFEARKTARMEETQAVSEAVRILMQDQARDAFSATYSLVQVSSRAHHEHQHRSRAAQVLRHAAKSLRDPQLSVLATAVELDAFTRVKKAIDDMIAMLKLQQSDEVKKSDYCKAQLQENEMTTAKTEDHKQDLEAKAAELAALIQSLDEGIAAAKAQIAQLQLELQRASEDRKKENLEFQTTVADQTVTQEVLRTALERLAKYYDQEALLQRARAGAARQAPPVPQAEYRPSKAAMGVMELLEKLILEAKGLTAESIRSESEAQLAYEQTVADTNDSVAALQAETLSKTKAKMVASKEKRETEGDTVDTTKELEGLAKYNSKLHAECDYVLKNFGTRQEARAQEVEALQQAKQILSGASLS